MDSCFKRGPSEKSNSIEDHSDDSANMPGEVPVYDWQKEELAWRKANLLKSPESALAWEEVKRRVRRFYGR